MKQLLLSALLVLPRIEGAKIGLLHVRCSAGLPSNTSMEPEPVYTLTSDPAGLFQITNSTLHLKPGVSISPQNPQFTYPIRVSATNATTSIEQNFLIVRDDFLSNGVIAHRGAFKHGKGKANSMTAFRDAIHKGFAHFECDTLFTADEQIVVAHGPLSGEDGGIPGDLPIYFTPYEDLKQVELGNGDSLPLLSEVLDLVMTQNRTRIVIEVKETPDGKNLQLATAISELVREKGAQAWVSYISFDYQILLKLLELDIFAKCSPLSDDHDLNQYLLDGMWGVDFNESHYDSREKIQSYQNVGLNVNAWTVNDPDRLKQLHDWGMDLITTDEPEHLLALR